MKVYAEWHGCPLSKAETELAAARLGKKSGLEQADAIVLFGCTVKGETERNMLKRIKKLSAAGKPLIVIGCLVDSSASKIRETAPEALLVGTGWLDRLETVFEKKELLGKRRFVKLGAREPGPWPVAIVPIAEGCLGNCSFCQVRLVRGELFSYPADRVLEDIQRAVRLGYKEVWLTAQDTAVYGADRGERLTDLLEAVVDLKGDFVVRLGMGNPRFFLKQWNRLLRVLESDRFFEFLHAPVQSGSERVVRHMRRNHSVEDFERLARKFHRAFPDGSLWTDIIVGYPAETAKDFDRTLELVEKTRPDKINTSRFEARPGTGLESADKLPGWVKKERSRRLVSLAARLGLEKNKGFVGRKIEVLLDEPGMGRTKGYRPVAVKGVLGNWVKAEVWGAKAGYLMAKPF